ncbi:MAG: hypothetical protein ACI3XZ_00490 [Butyricicoccus sp.]
MRFPIEYRGQDAGWVTVQTDGRGMAFAAESPLLTSAVLRLYAQTEAEPLRIGVLEPHHDILRLNRRISTETLRAAGVQQPPTRYYLEDGQPGCCPKDKPITPEAKKTTSVGPLRTGDALLDRLLESGIADGTQTADGWMIRMPFTPGRAHALSFALTACTIRKENGRWIVLLKKSP